MAKENSHAWKSIDLSTEENIIPEIQEQSKAHFGIIGSGKDEEYCLLTPEQKLGSQKECSRDHNLEIYLSSGSLSSDLSTKEGFEPMSSSSSSSDAESGTYKLPLKKYLNQVNGDDSPQPQILKAETGTFSLKEKVHMSEVGRGNMLNEMNDILYEELLEKVANNDVELKFTKKELESSQEEITRLQYQNLTLVEELGKAIENLRTSEDNMGRMEHKLKNKFQEEKRKMQDQLDLANQSIDMLHAELASEKRLVAELQQMVDKTTNDLSDYCCKIDELKLALHDAQKDFSKDRSQFQYDIRHLHVEKDVIDTRLKEAELRNKLLVEQIQQYDAEKVETRSLHEARESGLLDEIKQLKTELSQRCELIESLNQTIDASNLKYDMLMAEKDQFFAKAQTLGAEVKCRDVDLKQIENRVSQLTLERAELLAKSENSHKLVEELKLKVMDQESNLAKQETAIFDRAEEKREAIRQLCFSLEHYRNGYHELRQALIKNNR